MWFRIIVGFWFVLGMGLGKNMIFVLFKVKGRNSIGCIEGEIRRWLNIWSSCWLDCVCWISFCDVENVTYI